MGFCACRFASQLQSVSSSLSKVYADSSSALQRLAQRLNMRLDPQLSAPSSTSTTTSKAPAVDAILASLQTVFGGQAASTGAPTVLLNFVQSCNAAQAAASSAVDCLQKTADSVTDSGVRLAQLQVMTNPYSAAVQQLQRQLGAQQKDLAQRQKQQQELKQKVSWHAPAACTLLLWTNSRHTVVVLGICIERLVHAEGLLWLCLL